MSRPTAVQEREFDGGVWFFTEDPSRRTTEVRAHRQVIVTLRSDEGWVSLSGGAQVVQDPAKIDEPKPLVLFEYAKAAVAGGGPNSGEARTVELGS